MNFAVHLFLFHSLFAVIFKLDFFSSFPKLNYSFAFWSALVISMKTCFFFVFFLLCFAKILNNEKFSGSSKSPQHKLLLQIDLCGHHNLLDPWFNSTVLSKLLFYYQLFSITNSKIQYFYPPKEWISIINNLLGFEKHRARRGRKHFSLTFVNYTETDGQWSWFMVSKFNHFCHLKWKMKGFRALMICDLGGSF